jgi:hypothetical protein
MDNMDNIDKWIHKGFRKQFLKQIDMFISEQINQLQNQTDKTQKLALSQSESLIQFCKLYYNDILDEFVEMKKRTNRDLPHSMEQKFKKTYKNRFYNIRKDIEVNGGKYYRPIV